MKRILKFRYFDSNTKKLIYLPEGILNGQENLMQFTELNTDFSDGVDLYEGDIIRVKHGSAEGKIGVIRYNMGSFIIEGEYHKHQYYVDLTEDTAYQAELLGNIFENPEMPLSGGCWI